MDPKQDQNGLEGMLFALACLVVTVSEYDSGSRRFSRLGGEYANYKLKGHKNSGSPKGAGIRSPLCGRQTLRIMYSNGGAAGYTKHQGGSTAGRKCPFNASDLHYPL